MSGSRQRSPAICAAWSAASEGVAAATRPILSGLLSAKLWFGGAGLAISSIGRYVKAKAAVEIVFSRHHKSSRLDESERNSARVIVLFRVIRNKHRGVALN